MTPAGGDPNDEVSDLPHRFPVAPYFEGGDGKWHKPAAMRAILTFAILGFFAFTLGISALEVIRGYWEATREFSEVFLAAEIGVLGATVTFYFVERKED
jgi:hypothetical protein